MGAKKEEDKKPGFALGRENYKLMAIGFAHHNWFHSKWPEKVR
jgi:hypothetical protein